MTEFSKCSICLIQIGQIGYGKQCGYSKGKTKEETESALLNAQVSVIYLVHNILDIPLEQCSKYLVKYGNPADWVTLCQGCATNLERARDLYCKVVILQKKLDDLKKLMKNQMRVEDSDLMDLDEGGNCSTTPAGEIRKFLAYAHCVEQLGPNCQLREEKTDSTSKNPLTSDKRPMDKVSTSLEIDDSVAAAESMFFIEEEPDFQVQNSSSPKSVNEDFDTEFFESVNVEEEDGDRIIDKEHIDPLESSEDEFEEDEDLTIQGLTKSSETSKTKTEQPSTSSAPNTCRRLRVNKVRTSTKPRLKESSDSDSSEDDFEDDDEDDKDYKSYSPRSSKRSETSKTNNKQKSFAPKANKRLKVAPEQKTKGYRCHQCLEILFCQVHLIRHLNIKHSVPHDKILDMQMKIDTTGCYQLVTSSDGIKDKINMKTGKSPEYKPTMKEFECEICGLRLCCKTDLQPHIDKFHNTKVKSKNCPICHRHFLTDKALISHINEKPVQFCDSLFIHTSPDQLKRPFGCGHCLLNFASKKCLEFHVRTHENSRDRYLKHFRCNICGAQRNDFLSFVEHVTKHDETTTQVALPGVTFNKFIAIDQKTIELGTLATVNPKVYTNFNLCPNCDARFTPDSEEFKEHLRLCQKNDYKAE